MGLRNFMVRSAKKFGNKRFATQMLLWWGHYMGGRLHFTLQAWGLVSSDKRTIFRVIMPPFADHTLCDHNNCEAKHFFWELQHGLYQKFLCSLQQKCIHGKLPGNQDGSSGMVWKKKCYPGSMVIYGPNGTVFQRFAGEQWEPVETWIQDWEVPQGWNPRFADEGVRPTTN